MKCICINEYPGFFGGIGVEAHLLKIYKCKKNRMAEVMVVWIPSEDCSVPVQFGFSRFEKFFKVLE